MFNEYAQTYTKPLLNFTPYGTIQDRQLFETLSPKLKDALIAEGVKYLGFSYPPLSATAYMRYVQDGNRTNFETLYFERRNVLNTLVLAECVENKGRFLNDIINGIFALCEESSWQLPAHNSYVRDTPAYPLPDATRPILDLFACETGAQLAMIKYLLQPALDKVSSFIISRIDHEISYRIITPYLNEHFWWMGNGHEAMCNWTIWCSQNVLLTTFLTSQNADTKSKVLKKTAQSIDYFLEEYGEDGCCDEGAQYYRHAGLCLFNAMEVLNSVTNNYFAPLYKSPKIINMASYIYNVHVQGPYYINFADCSPKAGFAGVREYLFGKRTHNKALMQFAAMSYNEANAPLLLGEINLFYRVQSLFTDAEISTYHIEKLPVKEDLYYPSVGLFIAHDTHLTLAVKAGDNDDSHNHNDTGSFTIYKNGLPLFIDIGVESYTKKTFSKDRYEIWTMQSAYHNLPTLNGRLQKDGATYKASLVTTHFSPEESSIQMDLSGAYPERGLVKSYIRSAHLIKEKEIIITDTFTPNGPSCQVILNLITYEKPIIKDNQVSIGTLGLLTLEGGFASIDLEVLPITDPRLQTCWKHDLYRLRIHVTTPCISLHIK